MVYTNEKDIFNENCIIEENGKIKINEPTLFRENVIENIVDTLILSDSLHLKRICCWVAHSVGIQLKVIPSSIQGLYDAISKGLSKGFTVPAMNIRTLTYNTARAIFRAAKSINAGSFIFEIAKSEIGYTGQRPLEYSSMIILAAMKEGYEGPIFIQGDHFQVKASNYLNDKEKEVNQLKDVIAEAISGSFYNIDIDTSTLVDLSKEDLDKQQENNYLACTELTKYIRELQPSGVDISIGGEIGEVGSKNSTAEELTAFMKGYKKALGSLKGISKISIQTGTSHGGVVLPDGTIAKANIDFETLQKLSEISRNEYDMAGAVQHGASTLPNEAFHRFPEVGCAEIHLATQFQNMTYDYLPISLKEEIYQWLHDNCSEEKKDGITEDQFIYKTRKKALGPFKKKIHSLSSDVKEKIFSVLKDEFTFLFDKLNIKNTKIDVEKHVKQVIVEKDKDYFLKEEKDLGVLEGAD